jgi:hypothetical protein
VEPGVTARQARRRRPPRIGAKGAPLAPAHDLAPRYEHQLYRPQQFSEPLFGMFGRARLSDPAAARRAFWQIGNLGGRHIQGWVEWRLSICPPTAATNRGNEDLSSRDAPRPGQFSKGCHTRAPQFGFRVTRTQKLQSLPRSRSAHSRHFAADLMTCGFARHDFRNALPS